jgi:hypothetical protein
MIWACCTMFACLWWARCNQQLRQLSTLCTVIVPVSTHTRCSALYAACCTYGSQLAARMCKHWPSSHCAFSACHTHAIASCACRSWPVRRCWVRRWSCWAHQRAACTTGASWQATARSLASSKGSYCYTGILYTAIQYTPSHARCTSPAHPVSSMHVMVHAECCLASSTAMPGCFHLCPHACTGVAKEQCHAPSNLCTSLHHHPTHQQVCGGGTAEDALEAVCL